MTREEAIERLKQGEPFSELYDEKWETALNMAIEALQAQKTSQLISDGIGVRHCSNCRRIDDKYSVANFCWYCGAKYER